MDNVFDVKQLQISDYASSLPSQDLTIYLDKLTITSDEILPDPYCLGKSMWENDARKWPNIGYPDIYYYFVQSASFYTNEEIKCYKSLDGYHYFVCGHVQQVMFHDPGIQDFVYLMADVLPSQRQGTKVKMYKAYLIAKKTGEIHTTHCTCMAGTGKACSHAAAVAYKVEAAIRTGLTTTASTSSLCAWNDLSRKRAVPEPMSKIDFKRPRYGEDIRQPVEQSKTDDPSNFNLNFDTLKEIQPRAVVFSMREVKTPPKLPLPILSVIKLMPHDISITSNIFSFLSNYLSADLISNLEQMTAGQSKSQLWFQHRQGRITSSRMHRIFTLRDSTDRTNAIKHILEPSKFTTSATEYGIKMESRARKSFSKYHAILHDKFSCSESGLVLHAMYPHLGSSPDGILQCSCCGKGCLEIKCLKRYENGVPDPDSDLAINDKHFPINSDFELKKKHEYYTQVQGHMLICDVTYCDFYLWGQSKSIGIRVFRDIEFLERLKAKLTDEYKKHILPAIVKQIQS